MTNKDVRAFARENWADKTDTISNISSSSSRRVEGKKRILVERMRRLYTLFDDISGIFYLSDKPDSVDGLFFCKKECVLWNSKLDLKRL